MAKVCKCGSTGPFHTDRSKPDGLSSGCRACRNAYAKKWRATSEGQQWQKDYFQEIKADEKLYEKKKLQKEKFLESDKGKSWLRRYRREYDARRKEESPQFKLKCAISCAVWRAIKRRGAVKHTSILKILPYTMEDLVEHLESKFQTGMTWDNYGEWHIDHITPDSWFKYASTEDEEFLKSWSIDNLQPLWAEDNLKKGNHYAG